MNSILIKIEKIVFNVMMLGLLLLALAACTPDGRIDTNGVYYKSSKPHKPVTCVQVSDSYVKCYSRDK